MKSVLRLIYKKIQVQLPQLSGLLLLIAIGTAFFVTLFSIALRYEEAAEQFFISQAYADVVFYGTFCEESVRILSELDGIVSAKGRVVRDFREGERVIRVITLTEGINSPYIYTGRKPSDEMEALILRRNAYATGVSVGDRIFLGDREVIITGLAASPEYIYLVKNERITMAQPDIFGVAFVTSGFFQYEYNEIVALTGCGFCINKASDTVNAFRTITRETQINYIFFREELAILRTFAYIFPFVFALLIAVVIYVMLSRMIQKDKKQIGILKALGIPDNKIIFIYLSQFCFTALIGALIGCTASFFIGDVIIGIFTAIFEVPGLYFTIYLNLWIIAIITSVLLCALSGLIALASVLSLLPAHAMRPRQPRGGRSIFLEEIGFLWNKMSFNSRYAFKNSLRNKGRFLTVVLGMCGTGMLLTFSLGFYNSVINLQDKYFNGFANYDVIISLDFFPLSFNHPVQRRIDNSQKALILPVGVQGNNYTLTITDNDFDMFNLPETAKQSGIIIPALFAERWGVQAGDVLKIREDGNFLEIDDFYVIVSAVIPQYLGLMMFTGFDYINRASDDIPQAYNTIFGRTGDMESLILYLISNDIDFTTIYDDKTTFNSVMEVMSVLIWLMIGFSVVLGFTVLYSVGMINLSAREYEYMFIGVMGYPHKKILTAYIKEITFQLILAIPASFYLGYLLLDNIRGAFSNNNFVIPAVILPQSYIVSALSVIGVTAVTVFITSRHIERLDIVEGLKARDD